MLRLPEDGRRAVDLGPRVDQVDRVELVPAVVALVAACAVKAADRARALDIPIGQRVSGGGGERAERLALEHETLLMQRPEEILRDPIVVSGRRPSEEIV